MLYYSIYHIHTYIHTYIYIYIYMWIEPLSSDRAGFLLANPLGAVLASRRLVHLQSR